MPYPAERGIWLFVCPGWDLNPHGETPHGFKPCL